MVFKTKSIEIQKSPAPKPQPNTEIDNLITRINFVINNYIVNGYNYENDNPTVANVVYKTAFNLTRRYFKDIIFPEMSKLGIIHLIEEDINWNSNFEGISNKDFFDGKNQYQQKLLRIYESLIDLLHILRIFGSANSSSEN